MTMTYLVAMKSKDPSSKVGAVIVGVDKEIRSTGYNSMPRGVVDSLVRYQDSEYKLYAENHAEENAILNCARIGVGTKGCTIYTHWFPCATCARAIIQSGITEVVYDRYHPSTNIDAQGRWRESLEISRELLEEANVVMKEFSGQLIKISGMYRGGCFDPFQTDKRSEE